MMYFKYSLIFTVIGLILAALLGFAYNGTVIGALQTMFIVAVLGVLEVSISFDNAVVNATVLRNMTPLWRHRFLTWGIAIAVFGMRLVFPLLIVGIFAQLWPVEVIRLAAFHPTEYARILASAHVVIAAFGGAFLAMVAMKYFFKIPDDGFFREHYGECYPLWLIDEKFCEKSALNHYNFVN